MHTNDDSPSFGEDESDERTPSLGEGESDEHDHDCHILQPQENASCGVELSTSYPEQEATAWGDVEDYGQWKNLDECDPKWFAKVCVFAWYGCLRVVSLWSNERQYMYPHMHPPPPCWVFACGELVVA